MNDDERLLINRARNGDVQAFEELIEANKQRVFNIALRILGNYDDANELAQEAFVKAYRAISNFKGDCKFSTWIYRITTNVCMDFLRSRKKYSGNISLNERMELDDGAVEKQFEDYTYLPEEHFERKEIRKEIIEALNSLTEIHKVVVILRDINGFSYSEIAQILKCSEGTVKSRLNRARMELRKIILKKKANDYL